MSRKLSNNILEVMNRKVRPATLDQLKKRGLKRVSLLDLSDLNVMIKEAVVNTLGEMGIALRPRELKIQSDRVREEFYNITRQRDDLQELVESLKSEVSELKKNRGRLVARVESDKTRLEKEEKRTITVESMPLSAERIEAVKQGISERLADLFAESGMGVGLRERTVALTLELIGEERQKAYDEAVISQSDRVTQLKRRINKLVSKLDETEAILAAVESGQDIDLGVASIYKSVQGLKGGANFFEEKQEALKKIFDLNVELKKLMGDT